MIRVENAEAVLLSEIMCALLGIPSKVGSVHVILCSDPPHKQELVLSLKGAVGYILSSSKVGRCCLLGSSLALGAGLTAGLDALQDGLAVLVDLELGDDDVGRVDAERDGLAGGLLAGDALDVDHVLETVHGGNLALLVLVGAADNGDLVVLADGDAADLFVGARSLVTGWLFAGLEHSTCPPEGTGLKGSMERTKNVHCTSHGAPWTEGRS